MTKSDDGRSFVERVQQGHVSQPTQRKFSRKAWSAEFQKCTNPTIEEIRLHGAGIWFHEKLEYLRSQLENVPSLPIGREIAIRSTVGTLNAVVLAATHEIIEQLDELSHSSHKSEDPHGLFLGDAPARIDHVAETVISTARFPLTRAMRATPSKKTDSTVTDRDILQHLQRLRELGILYDSLENLWAECLWNGWYLETRGPLSLLTPSDWNRETAKALGIFRRQNLVLELTAYSTYMWKDLPLSYRLEMARRPRVVGIRRIGKDKSFEIGPASKSAEIAPGETVARTAAEELYFKELLIAPLPRLYGLTIRQLTEAWSILASVSVAQSARFPKSGTIKSIGRLLEYAPAFSRTSLTKLLAELLRVDQSTAQLILSVFVFEGNERGDLWLTPLVPVDAKNLVVVAPALEGPNLIRSIEFWMKKGGLSLDERGKLFERFVRSSLVRDNKLGNAKVFASAMRFEAGGIVEEIDLVVVIGRVILIGELKCSVFPSMPREFHNYFMTLELAADQIRRKQRFLESELSAFLKLLELEGEHEIVSVVVSNLPIGAGTPINGVAVTDYYILSRYLSEAKLDIYPQFLRHGGMEVTKSITFYTDGETAATAVHQYLLAPPQVQMYLPFVEPRVNTLYTVFGEAEAGAFVEVVVNMPASVGPPDIISKAEAIPHHENESAALPQFD